MPRIVLTHLLGEPKRSRSGILKQSKSPDPAATATPGAMRILHMLRSPTQMLQCWLAVTLATLLLRFRRRLARSRKPVALSRATEKFLNATEAAALELHDSLAEGHSVLLLHNLATGDECEALRVEASKVAACENAKPPTDRSRPWWSVPEAPGRMRLPLHHAFQGEAGDAIKARCDELLLRATRRLLTEVAPPLVPLLFGNALDAASRSLVDNPQITFSPREPAVNVYGPRGRFKPHKDQEALTVLVPLNGSEEFDGGGTAFWSLNQLDDAAAPAAGAEPSLVLVPPTGTAVVFVGSVTHAARVVKSGERCILVASFSPVDEESATC